MSEINQNVITVEAMSDQVLFKHLTWVGVVVATIAVVIALVANSVG